ncbi:hypothetical protein AMS68_004160 [Peltaster fructicola]|uniref:Uncharacterized protein n=1 Tax=Peltaster fructicola TaxID=286661 RepID=A0A6H0XV74_9PEZI|nr:hypothetical protein AMS68_004160 [Peltaster fructicola]
MPPMYENTSPVTLRRMLSDLSSLCSKPTPPLPQKSHLRSIRKVAPDDTSSTDNSDLESYHTATDGQFEPECRPKELAVGLTHRSHAVYNTNTSQLRDDEHGSSRPPSHNPRTDSVSSTIRFNAKRPDLHNPSCICSTCRLIRHQRRKITLKLAERLETSRTIMITIRDPANPSDHKRGRAYGHWLKLARLYVKYDMLVDTEISDIKDEDLLFVHFLQAFRALEKLVEDEKIEWGRLFGQQLADTVNVEHARLVNVIPIKLHKDSITGYELSR